MNIREQALERFKIEPTKCFQRHIRELYGELEGKKTIESLAGSSVIPIANEDAARFILKYEWLGTMASGTIASYGLKVGKEIVGVVCFSKGASEQALRNINPDASKVIVLARGACAPHAPKNAASKLIRFACKRARREWGWTHFVGYSDSQAGERGTIYKACNWKNVGPSEQGTKTTFVAPNGTRISSYNFNKRSETKFYQLGWDGVESKYQFLRRIGCKEQTEAKKDRWLWEEKAW